MMQWLNKRDAISPLVETWIEHNLGKYSKKKIVSGYQPTNAERKHKCANLSMILYVLYRDPVMWPTHPNIWISPKTYLESSLFLILLHLHSFHFISNLISMGTNKSYKLYYLFLGNLHPILLQTLVNIKSNMLKTDIKIITCNYKSSVTWTSSFGPNGSLSGL